MAKTEYGTITVTSTGPDTIILADSTLTIDKVLLAIIDGSTMAFGYSDGTVNFTADTTYGDSNYTKTLTHYKNISGTKTKVFETVVTLLDVGEFSINTTTCASPTQLKLVAYGN